MVELGFGHMRHPGVGIWATLWRVRHCSVVSPGARGVCLARRLGALPSADMGNILRT